MNAIEKIDEKKYMFPDYLLNSDIQARKEYFKNFVVPHPFLDNAVNKTLRFLNSPLSERLIFVCGPSGVGKTELINQITAAVNKAYAPARSEDSSIISVVNVEASAPEQGSFNFSHLWKQALNNLEEPLVDSKVSYNTETYKNAHNQVILRSNMSKADYHEVLINTLNWRRVTTLIINEAHHMLRVATEKKANWSIDLFKTLTDRSNARIVFVGTYALCAYLLDLDETIIDQINRRTKVVDFPRYHDDTSLSEVESFVLAAKKLLLHMPFEQTAEKLITNPKNCKFFYDYSLGCIGTLKDWFTEAYSFALDSASNTLTLEHLEETKMAGSRISKNLQSAQKGEARMAELLSDEYVKVFPSEEPQDHIKKDVAPKKSNSFERSAKRDPVAIRKS